MKFVSNANIMILSKLSSRLHGSTIFKDVNGTNSSKILLEIYQKTYLIWALNADAF